MKKLLLVVLMASGLVACNQSQAPKKDESRLREAYSACINSAKGNPDKVEACQSVLEVLKKDEQQKQFASKESVNVLDYHQCLEATQRANDQEVKKNCDKVWQEIRSNNNQ
ncbi:ChiQ/YbfN family lipoprotein [Pluralibacter gergoviae]|uniref:ChiQ/YbfN family lipoprotein n=1 Tax=Pluralibacter gergoviae TaxID=61647 RepID=A0AAW8HHX1_PLUGE|nr:ChiQ/YbfN family lipoprotein [Pluralibacter gergoviae]AVR03385.1 hypothetical protein A8H26_12170 [Pluralibacter gergoviae]EKV0928118.1 hypothetical protein [Pluralibacter gergoviae]EKW6620940.1 hypothetical protein [Pluralibacter gergoviae]EKW9966299.1 hypothetical protein [Pluralibacter gergoviae]EKZ9513241.1 hypothetical protein [Pluralibacter gergoviae]